MSGSMNMVACSSASYLLFWSSASNASLYSSIFLMLFLFINPHCKSLHLNFKPSLFCLYLSLLGRHLFLLPIPLNHLDLIEPSQFPLVSFV